MAETPEDFAAEIVNPGHDLYDAIRTAIRAAESRGVERGIEGLDHKPDLMPDEEALLHARRVRKSVAEAATEEAADSRMRHELIEAHCRGYAKAEQRTACPCEFGKPCVPGCTCANGASSRGCQRCCTYGSIEQRTRMADILIARERVGKTAHILVAQTMRGQEFPVGSPEAALVAAVDALEKTRNPYAMPLSPTPPTRSAKA